MSLLLVYFELIGKDLDFGVFFLFGDDGDGGGPYVQTYFSFLCFVLRLDKRLAFAYELGEVADAPIEVAPYKSYVLDARIEQN